MGSHPSSFHRDVREALDALRRIVQVLRASSRDIERRVGLSSAQLFALHQLSGAPGASVNDLAARTFTHQSSVSVVIQRLVKRRLVAKETAPGDRRRVELRLTDSGRALVRRSPEPMQDRLIAGISGLSHTERHTLTRALNEIASTMGHDDELPPMLFEERRPRARKRVRRAGS
jgi:DNA-binding MarR family transcriptional regulator